MLGGVAACVVAAKAARLLWLRAQLSFGPALVSKYAGQYALVTGGAAPQSEPLQQRANDQKGSTTQPCSPACCVMGHPLSTSRH